MLRLGHIVAVIIVLWVFIRTVSYAVWVWKQNKFGAISVFVIALLSLAVPIYVMVLSIDF